MADFEISIRTGSDEPPPPLIEPVQNIKESINKICEKLDELTRILSQTDKVAPTALLDLVEGIGEGFRALPGDILPEKREYFGGIRQNIVKLPGLEFKMPESHLIPNTRISNAVGADDLIDGVERKVCVSVRTARAPVFVTFLLDNVGSPIELPASLSEYDRCVYNSVCSLFTCNRYITAGMVYNAMTGGKVTGDFGEKQLDAVRNSLEKLSSIRISIDCNAQYQSYGVTCHGSEQWTFISNLLYTKAVQVWNNGDVFDAYELLEEPVLLAYARPLGQVISVPEKLLDVREVTADNVISGKRVRNTERRIALKGYLLRRIEEMRGVNAMANRCISFASYEKDGRHHKGLNEIWGLNDTPIRQESFKVREYAGIVLKYWTALGYISGFKLKTNGGGSIEIALPPGRRGEVQTHRISDDHPPRAGN